LCSAQHERTPHERLSQAAVRDAPRLDKAVRSQSDAESSSSADEEDDDDDDDEDFTVTRDDSDEPAAGARDTVSVS